MSHRTDGRSASQLRAITLTPHVSRYAEGSCEIRCGNTRVRCTATVEDSTPPWLRNTGKGWVTAEYGMLPRSTHSRMPREAAKGKQSGRTQEIQRLIGRALRACVDLKGLNEKQITIDCDVIEADGGTRTASITGGYVALHLALQSLLAKGIISSLPIKDSLAAISCGVVKGQAVLDLNYDEDSTAETDANFVLTGSGQIIEIQGTAEGEPFSPAQLSEMLALAQQGVAELTLLQQKALGA